MIEPNAQEELGILLGDKEIDFDDIRTFEELANTGVIQLYYDKNGKITEYTDYDDYIEDKVNERLKEEYQEKADEFVNEVKEIVEKEDYIKEENFENLAEEYQKEIIRIENIIENIDEKADDEVEIDVEEEKTEEKEMDL